MLVCVMRHGEAETNTSTSDEKRLTERGVSEVKKVLQLARKMGTTINVIASSPLARAKDTAEIAKRIFKADYVTTNSLEPEGSPEEIYEELSKYNPDDVVLLISHQPLVSKLLSDILGAETRIAFSTATLAMIEVSGQPRTGGGTLVLLIPPQISTS
jgi:phosphohistidine phosphatase